MYEFNFIYQRYIKKMKVLCLPAIYIFAFNLLFILCIYSIPIEAENQKIKIAYVFAGVIYFYVYETYWSGSARSFVCPKVHWTLKAHLIDAFGGDPYVFIRISTEDNANIKTGKGVLWSP